MLGSKLPQQPNQSIIDGMAIIQMLSESRDPISPTDIAKKIGVEITKVSRIVKTLNYLGFLERTNSRKYMPGPGIHVLAVQAMHGSGLLSKSIDHLQTLNSLSFQVTMGVLWNRDVYYFYRWKPGDSLGDTLNHMIKYVASKSIIGTLLLSHYSDEYIKDLYEGRLIDGYDSLDDFLSYIEAIRDRGYSISPYGEKSIAVGVGNPPVAAIALNGDLDENMYDFYYSILKSVADKIEVSKLTQQIVAENDI